ncbi:restriction endonuclease subunit S [Pseudomonas sp. NPDC079086]|uniref:restriction endonuclease subunit S n=1 Tax=unclassified Pseudomonas TaxID=196821 RepID=UPI0037C878CA
MSEWANVTLAHLATQRKGINYKSEDYGDEHSGHPFITIKCFVKGGGYESTGIKFYDGFSTKIDHLSAGDLLFSVTDLTRAGDIVGSPLKVPDFGASKPTLASMDCMRIEPIAGRCAKSFLYHRLMLSDVRRQMVAYAAGSTVLHLDTKKVPSIVVRIPVDMRLQSKIANILDSIDTAIEKAEALIAKYQQMKAGMMHDLFTRGVLPNGQLRPPRSEAPELYQETPVGWIPTAWCFTTCAKVCEKIIDCKNRTPPETPDGFPVIRTPNVRNGKFVDAELLYTDKRSYLTWTLRGKPQVGDIVITREAPVGEVCMIPDRHPSACLGQRMMLYRPDAELISPRYFLYALQSRQIKNRLDLISGGSTVGHVRVGDIRNLWMFMPTDSVEQIQIADALDGITVKLDRELEQLGKLRKQKLGLMQDMLTGRVPVQVEEPAPEMANG